MNPPLDFQQKPVEFVKLLAIFVCLWSGNTFPLSNGQTDTAPVEIVSHVIIPSADRCVPAQEVKKESNLHYFHCGGGSDSDWEICQNLSDPNKYEVRRWRIYNER